MYVNADDSPGDIAPRSVLIRAYRKLKVVDLVAKERRFMNLRQVKCVRIQIRGLTGIGGGCRTRFAMVRKMN